MLAFGRDTYMHDIITRLGASNAVKAQGWVQLSLEDVVRMNPEAIVLVLDTMPGSSPSPSEALRPLQSLQTAAVRDRRLALLTHPDALLPSSGVVEVADAMRGVLERLARAPDQASTGARAFPARPLDQAQREGPPASRHRAPPDAV